jgi:hypothetical protein
MDFKQRVCSELINCAAIYKAVLLDYEYLIYSVEFKMQPYYILRAYEDNFAHLTGVSSPLSAVSFYEKCLAGTVKESDIRFNDKKKNEKSMKGTIRRKIKSFSHLPNLFSYEIKAEENFSKGGIQCLVAAADDNITLGFIKVKDARPMTLLKGNCINKEKAVEVTLILRRSKGANKFDRIIYGKADDFYAAFPDV